MIFGNLKTHVFCHLADVSDKKTKFVSKDNKIISKKTEHHQEDNNLSTSTLEEKPIAKLDEKVHWDYKSKEEKLKTLLNMVHAVRKQFFSLERKEISFEKQKRVLLIIDKLEKKIKEKISSIS